MVLNTTENPILNVTGSVSGYDGGWVYANATHDPGDQPVESHVQNVSLNVKRSEDTCEDVCVVQKHNEFERQPSLTGLLKDTVRE